MKIKKKATSQNMNNNIRTAVALEEFILKSYGKDKPKLFNRKKKQGSKAQEKVVGESEESKEKPTKLKETCWWEPPLKSHAKDFFLESSLHGLKFVAQPKRHLSERIFWMSAFIVGIISAVLLINDVWIRYLENPVIVSFLPIEIDIDQIPFPAVTICDMNKISRSQVEKIKEIANMKKEGFNFDIYQAKEDLKYINSFCRQQQSFSKEFGFAYSRGRIDQVQDAIDEKDNLVDFILRNSQSCTEMIRLCRWNQQGSSNCSHLFKPILTKYGKCCTFNSIPSELLYYRDIPNSRYTWFWNMNSPDKEEQRKDAYFTAWPPLDIQKWREWDYSTFILSDQTEYPRRQKTPGIPYGLSILLDANIDDYFCTSSDSEGFRMMLHSPIEMPHIDEFGLSIGTDKDVFIDVTADLTSASDDIGGYSYEDRKCYFPHEKKLDFYRPFTRSNCVDECIAKIVTQNCSCAYFYMPRNVTTRFCKSDPNGVDFKCVYHSRRIAVQTLKTTCPQCDSMCTDISYRFQSTSNRLQNRSSLWGDVHPRRNMTVPPWSTHHLSIVHIFFGSGTIVPKLRKALYGTTDLIANTGGILGLCLGFSALSAIEMIYFFTFRACFERKRQKAIGGQIIKRFVQTVKSVINKGEKLDNGTEIPNKTIITIQPQNVEHQTIPAISSPLHPRYVTWMSEYK